VTVFVDTSAFYAMGDQNDESHDAAVAKWADLLSQEALLVTHNYVLLETSALLQNRLGMTALRDFLDNVVPLLTIDWVSAERHRRGVEAVLAAQRRKLSIVDCISFQTMRERGVAEAFCFDSHFRERGFSAIP